MAVIKSDGWVSVKDKLPPVHQQVLVLTRNGVIDLGEMFPRKDNPPSWAGRSDSLITHWMPLPQPPEEFDEKYGEDNEK